MIHLFKSGDSRKTKSGVGYDIKVVEQKDKGPYIADGWVESLDEVKPLDEVEPSKPSKPTKAS